LCRPDGRKRRVVQDWSSIMEQGKRLEDRFLFFLPK